MSLNNLFAKIVIDTRSIDQTMDSLKRLKDVMQDTSDQMQGASSDIKKSIDNQKKTFKSLADEVQQATEAVDADAKAQIALENAIAKATNRVANYVTAVKSAAVSEKEREKLIAQAQASLTSYADMLGQTGAKGLGLATANTQLAGTLGQLNRDLREAKTSLEGNETTTVATIRSLGQLEVSYKKAIENIKQSSFSTGVQREETAKLTDAYEKAKIALNTYGTGNAKAAKAQVDFRQSVGALTSQLEGANKEMRRKELENWSKQLASLNGSVQLALGPLSGIASRISALTGLFNRNAVAIASVFAATTGYLVLLSNSAKAAVETERQLFGLQARIEALGLQTRLTSADLDEMAHKIAANTLASAQGVREAQGALLEFSNVSVDSFEKVITAAQGMTSTFGGDLASNAARLARVMDDPISQFDALVKRGISFTKTERDKITLLQRSGNLFQAQAMILEKFESSAAKAQAESQTLAGALDTVSGNMDLLYQRLFLGSGAADEAAKQVGIFAETIAEFTNSGLADAMGQSFVKAVKLMGDIVNGVRGNFERFATVASVLAGVAIAKVTVATVNFTISLLSAMKAKIANQAEALKLSAAYFSTSRSMDRAAASAVSLRTALLGPLGMVLSLTAAVGSFLFVSRKLNDLKIEMNIDKEAAAKMKEYINGYQMLSDTEAKINNERLTRNVNDSKARLSVWTEEVDKTKAQIATLERSLRFGSYTGDQKKVIRQQVESLRVELVGLEADERRITLALKEQQAQLLASNRELENRARVANSYDYRNVAELIAMATSALDNESKAIADATQRLNELNAARDNAARIIANGGTESEVAAAKEQIVQLDRLRKLQEENLRYLQATTAAQRQRNAENEAVRNITEQYRNLNVQVQAYGMNSERARDRAIFASDQLVAASKLRAELAAVAEKSSKPAEFYARLAAELGDNVAPTLDAVVQRMMEMNKELEETKRKDSDLKSLNSIWSNMASGAEKSAMAYANQIIAIKELDTVDETVRQKMLDRLAEMKAVEDEQMARRIAQAATFKTLSPTEQLAQEFEERKQLIIDYYGQEHEMTKLHMDNLEKEFARMQMITKIGEWAEDGAKLFGGAMDMMTAMGRENSRAGQAIAIGQAMMNASVAATKAFAEGGPFLGPALAAMIAVKTGAEIKQIRSQKFNSGGFVSGGGTAKSDSIPAMLSNGEFVLQASAVQKLGLKNLEMMNMGKMPAFSTGGVVGFIGSTERDSGVSGSVVINVIDQRSNNSEAVQTTETTDAEGNRVIEVLIKDAVTRMINTGQLDRPLGSNYGLSRQGIRR